MDTDKIAKFLAELREENNYTQYDLADILHIRRESVSKWERGVNIPSPDLLLRLSELYKVSVNELLIGERITKENEYKKENLPVEILRDSHKRIKKIINRTIAIVILVVLTFFIIFFINNYKSIKIYTVNSEDYKIKDGIILLSRDTCYFKLGEINTDEFFNYYKLYFKLDNEEKMLAASNNKEVVFYYNFIDENEYNYNKMLYAIENLYVDIYKDNEKIDSIKLNSNRVYNNDKITYSKEEDSGDFVEDININVPEYIKKHFKFDKDNNQYVYEEKKNDVTYKYSYALDGFNFTIEEISKEKKCHFEYSKKNSLLTIIIESNDSKKSYIVYNLDKNNCLDGDCNKYIELINRFNNTYLPSIKDRT